MYQLRRVTYHFGKTIRIVKPLTDVATRDLIDEISDVITPSKITVARESTVWKRD